MPNLLADTILKEAAKVPGGEIVAALRQDQPYLWQSSEIEYRIQLRALGVHVAAVANAEGGLILETTPRQRIEAIVNGAALDRWIKLKFGPVYERLYKRTANQTMATLSSRGFPITNRTKVEERVLKELGKRMGLIDLSAQAKESLFRILNISRDLGLSPRAASYLIEDMVPRGRFIRAGVRYRSELIAQSEMLHAQRISTISSFKGSRFVKELVAFDGDHDSECLSRNGSYYSFDEAEVQAANTHPKCVLAFGPVT